MTWALQDAKNKFSAVSDAAWRGTPQIVTRHGKPIVVVISKVEKSHRKNIWEAFRECPVDADLDGLIPARAREAGRRHEEALDALFA